MHKKTEKIKPSKIFDVEAFLERRKELKSWNDRVKSAKYVKIKYNPGALENI